MSDATPQSDPRLSAMPSTPSPAAAPQGQPTRASGQPMVEEVYYDGPSSWWGQAGRIASTLLLTLVLIAAAVLAALKLELWHPWPSVILVMLAMVPPARLYLLQKSTRFKLTNYRVDYERGVLNTRIDSIELWHVDDIAFRQPLFQRLAGVGTIELRSDDRTNPVMVLPALPAGRQLYETLKTRIIAAKRERGLLELDQ